MAKYSQPVISRETRLLLTTIVVSVLALWVLARIRFYERPMTSDPVPPVLAQLRPQSSFEDLARSIADMRPAIAASILPVEGGVPALRVREDAAVALAPARVAAPSGEDSRLAFDPATGLAVVRSPSADLPGLMPWVPRILDYPRYFVVAEVAGQNVSLRPVFVSGLVAAASPLWLGEIWVLPTAVEIPLGTFLFTTDGALAGLAIEDGRRTAILPATHLLKLSEQLLQAEKREPGEIGVLVQPISGDIASATGAAAGVVVTAVDPNGPASGTLVVTDVIEAVSGQEIATAEHWRARVARLHAGDTLSLRVRRGGAVRDVQLTAAPFKASAAPSAQPEEPSLGVTLRAIPKVGAEVLSVEPQSHAARATLAAGDVITVAGQQTAPTPTQVVRAFNALPSGGSLVIAVTRGSEHRVVALKK